MKGLSWHPHKQGLLLIGCAQEEKAIYMWDCEDGAEPEGWLISSLGGKSSLKGELKWLEKSQEDSDLTVFLSDGSGALVAWPKR